MRELRFWLRNCLNGGTEDSRHLSLSQFVDASINSTHLVTPRTFFFDHFELNIYMQISLGIYLYILKVTLYFD
jgi:hypothetical protein